jgi:hypothetical protein
MRRWLAIGLLVTASGCGGEPTLDASSEDAFRESVRRMSASLPSEDRTRFQKATMYLAMGRPIQRELSAAPGKKSVARAMLDATAKAKSAGMAEEMRPYHGLTARELLARAVELQSAGRRTGP